MRSSEAPQSEHHRTDFLAGYDWEVDASGEHESHYGYAILPARACMISADFRNAGGSMKRVTPGHEAKVDYSTHHELPWSSILIEGSYDMPSIEELQDLTSDIARVVLIVSATTHGASRFRTWAVNSPRPGEPAQWRLECERNQLRGVLEIKVSLALAEDVPFEVGKASRAGAVLTLPTVITVEIDPSAPVSGPGMDTAWTDHEGRLILYSLDIDETREGTEAQPKIRVILNNKSPVLMSVLRSTDTHPQRMAARRIINAFIAVGVFSQLASYARDRKVRFGLEDRFTQKLIASLRRRGITDEHIEASNGHIGQINISDSVQHHLKLSSLSSKLVEVMDLEIVEIGDVE